MARTTVGFDIGARAMKLAKWDGSTVRGTAVAPVPDNLVQNGVILSYAAMSDLIRETVREHRLTGRECAVVLPAGHVFLRQITLPAMTVDQLRVNLPYEFRDFLTMDKDQYFYDYAVNKLERDGEGVPRQMDLTAAAVPKEVVAEYRDMFRRAGFRLRTAIPAECAYVNLLRARFDSLEGRESSFLDLGHTASRLHIFTGTRFEATRVIELGLSSLDDAIADALGVDQHIAQTYKISNHRNVQALEGALAVYNAIALDTRKAVNFYGFNNRESSLRDLWCCGGGVHIPALLDAITQSVELTIHDAAELLPPAVQGAEGLSACAAAIGAAIQRKEAVS